MGRNSFPRLAILWCILAPALPAAAGQAAPAAAREDAVIRQILELERHTKDAALRNDAGFAERTLADDYLAIGPLGTVITKSDAVSARRAAHLHYDSIEVSELVVRLYGETAVVTARAKVKGKDLAQDFSGPYRFTRVWVRRDGEWQTVSYQATATQ